MLCKIIARNLLIVVLSMFHDGFFILQDLQRNSEFSTRNKRSSETGKRKRLTNHNSKDVYGRIPNWYVSVGKDHRELIDAYITNLL